MISRHFYMDSFIAVSPDTYNRREHIIYCIGHADEFFDGSVRNVTCEKRAIGEFISDFSYPFGHVGSRQNILFGYISCCTRYAEDHPQCIGSGGEMREKQAAFARTLELMKTPLMSEQFIDIQSHMTLNSRHRYDPREVLKSCCPEVSADMGLIRTFYIDGAPYIATDTDLTGLLMYYLDELYAAGMFPRKCANCGRVFLSGKKQGTVLCSAECRKQRSIARTGDRCSLDLSEKETVYTKIYRKWRRKIDGFSDNHALSEAQLAHLRGELSELTRLNRVWEHERKKGDITDLALFDKNYHDMLMSKDKHMYRLLDSFRKTE